MKWWGYFLAGAFLGPALLTVGHVLVYAVGLVAIIWVGKTAYLMYQAEDE